MIITIHSIGIIKNSPISELQEDYKNRIANQGKLIGIKDVIIKENRSSKKKDFKARTHEEFTRLTKDKDKNSFKILLDRKGKRVDSENISQLIKDIMEIGQNINFYIGGSDGIANKNYNNFDKIITFGELTWPHRMFRIMLMEQIYRALTIINNHPYHK
ncbi:MAG: 23S rRNA (pseudouridine(1915)-N(3))-methyltransferase RlmH [Pseudomonadota bacterium]|nr:23S rRNA (pseudouridine(1915)-N(3))-methyltransferase RlmH [Pseudomonadota bacterium]